MPTGRVNCSFAEGLLLNRLEMAHPKLCGVFIVQSLGSRLTFLRRGSGSSRRGSGR